MAVFLPARADTSPRSHAEKKVLGWLEGLPDEWTVLHSVGIANHDSKPWAEADVVLIGPRGVLVLEVKGGRVERKQGLWGFRDRFDRVTWKVEGPYEQAGGAAAALRDHLVRAGVADKRTGVHWAVVLPDVSVPSAGPDVLKEVTLDASRGWAAPLAEMTRIFGYWRRRVGEVHDLDRVSHDRIVETIRGDLSLVPLAALVAGQVQEHQARLTREQAEVLRCAAENPRLLVSGRAGTGKTALALRTAVDLSAAGRRTALVVFNRALTRRAAEALSTSDVTVTTLDSLVAQILDRSPGRGATHDDFVAARDAAASVATVMFDALVLDEAQDLDESSLRVLDRVLAGGLAHGTWRAFHDVDQDIFGGAATALSELSPAVMRLTRNCRSTKQIVTATSSLARIMLDVETSITGPEVSYEWWSRTQDHDSRMAEVIRDKVAAYGADNVLVVGRRKLDPGRSESIERGLDGLRLEPLDSATGPYLATTSEVKGLESVAVVVHGVDRLSTSGARAYLYTACSRASVDLTVLLHEGVRADWVEGGHWLGEQLRTLMAIRRSGADS